MQIELSELDHDLRQVFIFCDVKNGHQGQRSPVALFLSYFGHVLNEITFKLKQT